MPRAFLSRLPPGRALSPERRGSGGTRRLLIGLLACSAAFLTCDSWPDRKAPSVILISIDTCRADYLGCYGCRRNTTPNIDAFAGEATLFTRVVSPVPTTLPSHCSMLTGTIPPHHGVRDNIDYRLDDDNITIAELLRVRDYETAAIIGAFVLDSQFGLNQGFDVYDDRIASPQQSGVVQITERKADKVTDLASNWLENRRPGSFFLFLHYYDPHVPYAPPEPYASRFRNDLYAGEIAYTDHCIGRLFDKLKNLHLYNSCLIIVTSDHGEALGDHAEAGHGYFIYQSTISVPLIVKLPGSREPNRVHAAAGLVDIVPSILGHLGIQAPLDVQGRDLSFSGAAQEGDSQQREFYCESLIPTKYDCNPLFGIVTGWWKYIETTRPELYDLHADANETDNLIAREQKRARLLRGRLRSMIAGTRVQTRGSQPRMDATTRQRLESLGYVAGRAVDEGFASDPNRPDPKDLIHLHEDFEKALFLVGGREFDAADALCDRMLAKGDHILDVHILKGDIAFERGEMAEAAEHYAEFLDQMAAKEERQARSGEDTSGAPRLSPNHNKAHYNLANVLAEMGRKEEALGHYRKALQINSNDINNRFNFAITLAEMGLIDQAAEQFSAILKVKPDHVKARLNLGQALAQKGRVAEAALQYSEALRIEPGHAGALERLGDLLAARGRLEEAVARYSESAERWPDLPEPRHKLARALLALGKPGEAIKEYREILRRYPGWPAVANELAWVLATHEDAGYRDGQEALRIAKGLNRQVGENDPMILETLAAAYAELGRFGEAVEAERKALGLAVAQSAMPPEAVQSMRMRLEQYRARRPARTAFEW